MSKLLVKGLMNIRNLNYNEAMECFDNILNTDSGNAQAIVGKAYCYYCFNNIVAAKKLCREIDKNSINGAFSVYYDEIMRDDEFESDNGSSVVDSEFFAKDLLSDGVNLIEDYDYNKALDCFYKILSVDSRNVKALVGVAYCFYCFGQYDEAHKKCLDINRKSLEGSFLNYYNKIMSNGKHSPISPSVSSNNESSSTIDDLIAKGMNCIENIEYNDAIYCFDYVLNVENDNEKAIVGKSYCIFVLGDYSLAQNMCNNINYKELEGTLFDYYKEIMIGDINSIPDSPHYDPDDYSPESHKQVDELCEEGFGYIEIYQFKKAKKSFNRALKLQRNNPNVIYGNAVCLFHLGYYKPALNECEKAMEIDENSVDYDFYQKIINKAKKYNLL